MIDVRDYIVHKKDYCSFVLYFYLPVQQNAHSCCELDSETLVGVSCGGFLAI
jgi:hypothetical protein